MFDVETCMESARSGRLDDWVDHYLSAGPWANEGLRQGLRLQRRHWLGPLLVTLDRLERCCGPEPGMPYHVDAAGWRRRISEIAETLAEPIQVPPLIVEWRDGQLSVRDGNHRYAAMVQAGWPSCWAIVWCNDATDFEAASKQLS